MQCNCISIQLVQTNEFNLYLCVISSLSILIIISVLSLIPVSVCVVRKKRDWIVYEWHWKTASELPKIVLLSLILIWSALWRNDKLKSLNSYSISSLFKYICLAWMSDCLISGQLSVCKYYKYSYLNIWACVLSIIYYSIKIIL